MSLQIVSSRYGADNNCYCQEEIRKLIFNNEQVLYIIPEQISFETERDFFCGSKHKFNDNLTVLSFSRLASSIFSKYGPLNSENITEPVKIAFLKRAILKCDNLKAIPKDSDLEPLLNFITEFKRSNITVNDLEVLSEKISKFRDLKKLMSDVEQIYCNYQTLIHEHLNSSESDLTLAVERLKKYKPYLNHTIFIDSFDDFSVQEFEVIKSLITNSKKVILTLIADKNLSDESVESQEYDIFSIQKRVAYKLIDYAKLVGVKVDEIAYLECGSIFENLELKYLENKFLEYNSESYEEEAKNIKILAGSDRFDEIELVTNQIIDLCRDKNYRYRDILILTTDPSGYLPLIKEIFGRYKIPYFFNEQNNILHFSLSQTIIYIFEIILNKFQLKDVLNYAKLGFLDLTHKEICEFENYCLATGINSNSWFITSDWKYIPTSLKSLDLESLNTTRHKIIDPLVAFIKNINSKSENGLSKITDITIALFEFISKLGIPERVQENITRKLSNGEIEEARLEKQVWELIVNSFEILVNHLGDEKISVRDFFKLLQTIFRNQEVSKVPPTCDQVAVGLIGNAKNKNIKCTIIIGANDGIFPNTNDDFGYLSGNDRDTLISAGLNLPYSKLDAILRNEFLVYQSITSPKSKLFLSYSLISSDGTEMAESVVIKKVKKIFPNIEIVKNNNSIINLNDKDSIVKLLVFQTSDMILRNNKSANLQLELSSEWLNVQKWISNNFEWNQKYDKALSYLNYSNAPTKLSDEQVKNLYFSDSNNSDKQKLNMSVTRLEQFATCSFSYYLKYGLHALPRELAEPNSLNIGSILHEVVFRVLEEFKNLNIWDQNSNSPKSEIIYDINKLADKRVLEVTEDVLNQFLTPEILRSPRFSRLHAKVSKIIGLTVKNTIEFYITSGARPIGYEIKFQRDIPNSNIRLIGKIDRADAISTAKKDYIFVVDYKSGSKLLDYSDFYYGIKMQLPVYGAVLQGSTNKNHRENVIAGLLYKKFDNCQIDIAKYANKSDSLELAIQEKISESIKMTGMLLSDILVTESSKFMKESAYNHKLSYSEIGSLVKYSKFKLFKISQSLTSGEIEINPMIIRRSRARAFDSCEYCEYPEVCKCEQCNVTVNKKIHKEEFFSDVSKLDDQSKSGSSAS